MRARVLTAKLWRRLCGCGSADIGVADGLPCSLEADVGHGLVEPSADQLVIEAFLSAGRQKTRVGIGAPQAAAHGQVVVDLGGHTLGMGIRRSFLNLVFSI